jgi:type II secretory pathway component PulK
VIAPSRRPRSVHRHARVGARQGFALLAVLWIIIGMSALALALNLSARSAIGTAANRRALARARWRAEGCLEIARSVIADVLAGQTSWLAAPGDWSGLDQAVTTAPVLVQSGCTVEFHPSGIVLDVNAAGYDAFRTLFRAAGLPPLASDSLAAAILDWRGSPGPTHPFGATRAWYDSAHRFPPRGGNIADIRELSRIRGYSGALARVPALDTLLTTEPGRIVISRAPLPVIATIPGMTDESLSRIADLRSRGRGPIDLTSLGGQVSPAARAALGSQVMSGVSWTTTEPEAWIVTARATSGVDPSVTAWVEARIVHAGPRAAIVRRRTWP